MISQIVPSDLIGPTEAAEMLSVHPKTIRRWVSTGKVKSYRLPSGQHRVSRSEVLALVVVTPVSA